MVWRTRTPGCAREDSSLHPAGRSTAPARLAAPHPLGLLGLAILLAIGGCSIPSFKRAPSPTIEPQPTEPPTIVEPVPTGAGMIRGRLLPDSGPSGSSDKLSTVVVYADPIGDRDASLKPPSPVTIRRLDDSFSPEFSVVSVGQTVHFSDDGDLFHRVFSYSKPNAFDLGAVGGGKRKSIVFHHPGLVRFYCKLHGWEGGAIYVAPSQYFDTARPTGEYELSDLPPGDYRVGAWSEAFSGPTLAVTVHSGHSTSLELPVRRIREPK